MAFFKRKPEYVEALTFKEFAKYGIEHATNLVNGQPWSFDYKGLPITQENEWCYIIPTKEDNHYFMDSDILVTNGRGETFPVAISDFWKEYEPFEGQT